MYAMPIWVKHGANYDTNLNGWTEFASICFTHLAMRL